MGRSSAYGGEPPVSEPSTTTGCARCGGRLARDNHTGRCAPCHTAERGRLVAPPEVPGRFWEHGPVRRALTERHFGRLLRAYRHHPYHGRQPLPQTIVAGWLGLTQAQLSRVETGAPVVHLDRLVRWARLLQVPAAQLWFRLPQPRTESVVIGDDAVPDSHLLQALRSADRQIGGRHLYATVVAHLDRFSQRALEGGSWPRRAFAVAASMHEMAGWMAHDSGSPRLADRHFRDALGLAERSGETGLAGQIRGSLSHLASHQGEAVAAISHAVSGLNVLADDRTAGSTRARLFALHARGLALAGRTDECHAALQQAERALTAPHAPRAEWFSPFDANSLQVDVARCLLRLGDLTAAVDVLDGIIDEQPVGRVRSQALARLLLAAAMIGQGRADEACPVVHQAMEQSTGLGSAVVVDHMRQVALLLRSHVRRCAEVPPLLDRLQQTFQERNWLATPLPNA
ncbi:DNA-binding protein [Micromonospora rifamycinica]|uniref:Helix-turn-helix domain-containing protein n=1 Tax=Micromonospora rifamycinica TaxID=291594 RepID=A0A109IJ75_9ACTN|nr:DNA-binding protein [Micromonospora rifamycinica]SCG75915.1 Helix-turn-helix domain-containing protein [Micromonospora rifamycinica]